MRKRDELLFLLTVFLKTVWLSVRIRFARNMTQIINIHQQGEKIDAEIDAFYNAKNEKAKTN